MRLIAPKGVRIIANRSRRAARARPRSNPRQIIRTGHRSIDSLRRELVSVWQPREVSDDWLVRFEARKYADYLRKIIKQREKQLERKQAFGPVRQNPRGSRVARCVRSVAKRKGVRSAYAICQKATGQSYRSGRRLNPSVYEFKVSLAGAGVARFRSLPRAKQYAQALANRAGRQVRITR